MSLSRAIAVHYAVKVAAAAAATAAKSLQSCPTLCDPIDSSPPGSPSLGFSRQEHWSGLPLPSLAVKAKRPKIQVVSEK